jgi:CheY-like chemotaxis protein
MAASYDRITSRRLGATAVGIAVMGKAARILLVDDRHDVRESTTALLEAAGYVVVESATEEQALSLLASDPSIDLLITDIVLGRHSSGFVLAQRAKRIQPSLKILYTTGYAGNLEELYPSARGGRMLRKPFRALALLREIDLLLDATAPVVAAPDHTAPPRVTPKPTILVVEDDARSRGIAVELFDGLELQVLSAGDAEDALMILANHPEISTVFTDIRLPGMSGSELAVEAWKLRPDLTIVLTSAYTDVSHVPGTRFVPKPWSKEIFGLVAGSVTRH